MARWSGRWCFRGGTCASLVDGEPRAQSVQSVPNGLTLELGGGRTLTVPLEWFARLRDASDADRKNVEIYADDCAIHWPDNDEDISVAGLLGLPD